MTSKLNSLCFLFRNLRKVLTTEQLLTIYHGHVESRIRYAIAFWHHSALSDQVSVCQKIIVRIIMGVPKRHTCRKIFADLKILTLSSIVIFELCTYVFEHKSQFPKIETTHDYNTRNKEKLIIPFNRLELGKSSPNTLAPKMFNILPKHITEASNSSTFKRNLKTFLVANVYYTLDEFFNCT